MMAACSGLVTGRRWVTGLCCRLPGQRLCLLHGDHEGDEEVARHWGTGGCKHRCVAQVKTPGPYRRPLPTPGMSLEIPRYGGLNEKVPTGSYN